MRVLSPFDFRKKVTTIELGGISTHDNCVRVERELSLHSCLAVGRDLISRPAQHSDDLLPETIVRLHHQNFPWFVVHNASFLGWCPTVTGFNSGRLVDVPPQGFPQTASHKSTVERDCQRFGTRFAR